MITGLAHVGVCVPDVDDAVEWYRSVLGMTVLSPPITMSGPDLARDMGELVPDPVLRAAIVGFEHGDKVLELIQYPEADGRPVSRHVVDQGFSHLGLVCDDIEATRAELERHGVEFLVSGIATLLGLRTTWFRDPYGMMFILLEKRDPLRSYYTQF